MEAAAAFLSVRPRSVQETRRRLRYHGYPHPLVEQVLTRLVGLGYLDDEVFARAWVESRDRARPRGSAALRRELSLKGVASDVIAAILEERSSVGLDEQPPNSSQDEPSGSPDEHAAARLLQRRRAALDREADPRRRRQRAYALLARNGFDPATVTLALRTLDDERGDDPANEQHLDQRGASDV